MMPRRNVPAALVLAWNGTIKDHETEKAFQVADYEQMYGIRAVLSIIITVMQMFCFWQDYEGVRPEHRDLAIEVYSLPLVLSAVVMIGYAIIARCILHKVHFEPSASASARLFTKIGLGYRDFIWGAVILANAASFQARMLLICQGGTAGYVQSCNTYVSAAFPLPPTLHALASAAAVIIMSQTYVASITVTAAILALLAWQTNALYHVPTDPAAARMAANDMGFVATLTFLTFGSLLLMGAQWPLYRRRQFLAMRALEAKFEEYRAIADQLREADVREKKLLADTVRAQALEGQMEDRANLLRYLFHEIRVPLNTVVMGIELLQEDATGLDPESSANLAMMRAAAGTAVSTLSDALDLSKLERSQNEPPPLKPTRVLGLLEDAVTINKPFAAGNGVQLSFDWQRDGLPEWVLGDPQGLKQVLNNFVTNAIKFCRRDGTGRVKVWAGLSLPPDALAEPLMSPRAHASEDTAGTGGVLSPLRRTSHMDHPAATAPQQDDTNNSHDNSSSVILAQLTPPFLCSLAEHGFQVVQLDQGQGTGLTPGRPAAEGHDATPATVKMAQVYLAVSDNGVGISQVELPKLYSAFQQLDAGIEYKGRGTGLGLAISKGIVGRLQGRVGVRSAEGHGSVFYVVVALPVLQALGQARRTGSGTDTGAGMGVHASSHGGSHSPRSVSSVGGGMLMVRTSHGSHGAEDPSTARTGASAPGSRTGHRGMASVTSHPDPGQDASARQTSGGDATVVVTPTLQVPGAVEDHDGSNDGGSGSGSALSSPVPSRLDAARRRSSVLGDGGQHARTIFLGSPTGSDPFALSSGSSVGAKGTGGFTRQRPGTVSPSPPTDTVISMDGTGPSQPSHAQPAPVRVLVVEDVLSNRTMLVKLLGRRWVSTGLAKSHGPLECYEVENGELALQIVSAAPPGHFAAVLMDGNMPVLDGYEATIRLRQDHGYKGLILGLTGNGLPADVERFRAAGADDVLIKPADCTDVAQRIGRALPAPVTVVLQP